MSTNEFKVKIAAMKKHYEEAFAIEKRSIVGMEKFDPELHKLLMEHFDSAEKVYLHLCKRNETNPLPEKNRELTQMYK